MKHLKRSLSLILVLVMCLSLLPAAAFADTKREYHVLNIGDSTSNGYGLPDYGVYADADFTTSPEATQYYYFLQNVGFLGNGSKQAYPARLARCIQEQHPDYNVTFTNLGISGMRNTEMRAIIDSDFAGDSYTEFYMGDYMTTLRWYYGVDSMHDLYVDEIKRADLITLDALSNSFTDYMSHRLAAVVSGDFSSYPDTLAGTLGTVSPQIKAIVDPLEASLRAGLSPALSDNVLTGVIDTIVYCVADCLVNFSEIVKLIYELNPDVTLLVGEEYSPFRATVNVGGVELDIESVLNSLVAGINTYITAGDRNCLRYSVIELPDGIETAFDYIGKYDSPWELPYGMLKCLVDNIFSLDHTVATILCTEVREEATARGLDISDYTCIYPEYIMNYIDRVYAGETLPELEQMFVDKFMNFLSYYIAGAKTEKLEIAGLVEALQEDFGYGETLDMRSTPIDELTDVQRTKLWFFVMTKVMNGVGPHFSVNGCSTKYESALKAYNEALPAVASAPKTVASIVKNAVTAYKNTVNSILKLIKK